MENPANVFVDTRPQETITVDYHRVAEQIRALKPRELKTEQLDDVLTLIEWMQEQCLRTHENNLRELAVLDAREKAVSQLEKECALRSRTVRLLQKAVTPEKPSVMQRLLRR